MAFNDHVCVVCSTPLTTTRCCIKCWNGLDDKTKDKWWKDTKYGCQITDEIIKQFRETLHEQRAAT